jgi:hypothetical protein
MALVHPNSCECTKSELDLFEVPPTQTSVAYGYWEQKGLTSTLTDQGPYEFAVSLAGDDYIDLANTYLFVEAQNMNDDDTALDGGATLNLSTYGCIPSLVMSVLASTKIWFHHRPACTLIELT